MHRQTRAKAIPKAVKMAVYERDRGHCVLCGANDGQPDAHIVARSQGGKGIEQNIVTLCRRCHDRYDNSADRHEIRERLERYIKQFYPAWTEEDMIYRKYDFRRTQCKE